MPARRTRRLRQHALALLAMLFVAPMPCLLATRLNYTWSLLLFALPCALVLGWFAWTPEQELAPVRRAFTLTLGLLVPMGLVLNLLFAGPDWTRAFPIEEFAFYGLGFLATLLVYLWGDAFFVKREHVRDAHYREQGPVVQLALGPAVVGASVVLGAWGWKATHGGGFPGYLAFLVLVPFVVSVTFYRVSRSLVNWPAFTLMILFLLGTSVLWEVTLALPGGWWDYRPEYLLGLRVAPWHGLPLEAVLVWFLAGFASITTFEAMKVFVHHPAPSARERLFGPSKAPPPIPAA